MTYSFDIDGTLTADPLRLGEMMKALRGAGHTVIVMTGCVGAAPCTAEYRRDQLLSLSPPMLHTEQYDHLDLVGGATTDDVGRGKGRLCKDLSVDIMIEDTAPWCQFIRAASPKTTCLLMAGAG